MSSSIKSDAIRYKSKKNSKGNGSISDKQTNIMIYRVELLSAHMDIGYLHNVSEFPWITLEKNAYFV